MTSETLQTDGGLQGGDLLRAGLPPANDRMLTTCFLAALLHGIIILGRDVQLDQQQLDR